MKEIDDYVHVLFSSFEENDDLKKLKKNTHLELTEKFKLLTQQGMSVEDALLKIKIEFGAKECIMFQLNEGKSIRRYNSFKAAYPKLKNIGLIAVGAVTVFAMTLAGTTQLKLQSLVTWIVLILLLIAFEIAVEYIDYWFSNRYSYIKPEKTEKQQKKEDRHRAKEENKKAEQQKKAAELIIKQQHKNNK